MMSIQGTSGSIPFPAQRAGQAYASQARAIQPARPQAEAVDATPSASTGSWPDRSTAPSTGARLDEATQGKAAPLLPE